jgi:L-iditol 2-dehydrogenase
MRVAVYYNNRDVRLEERPKPQIGPRELLVKVRAAGLCGTDVLEWYRVQKAPRVLGHEITGEIAEVGEEVRSFQVGERVFVSHHVPCTTCRYCLRGQETVCETLHTTNFDPGGFSEYVRVPEINVEKGTFLLPEEVTFEDGTFIEPVGCVLRGQRLADIQLGDTVLILGSGIAGLLHIQVARLRGAGWILATDVSGYRLEAARRFGADAVIHAREEVPSKVRELNEGRLADKVILCTGAPSAVAQGLRSVDRGGLVLFFAVPKPGEEGPVPLSELWRNEIALKMSYAAAPRELFEAIELIRRGQVNVRDMITHRLGLGEAGRGFRMVAEAGESIKVIIDPQR